MSSQQRQQIKKLIRFLSANSGGESSISFVASNNGMLAACQELQKNIESDDNENIDWLKNECGQASITYHYFLQHLSRISILFTPAENSSAYYDVLGLAPGASRDEIKQNYRKLSLRYHPDTASGNDPDASEKFMQITKAYHVLLDGGGELQADPVLPTQRNWQPANEQRMRPKRPKSIAVWLVVLVVGGAIFSAIASNMYRKQAMLTGLQESRGAFEPPVSRRQEVERVVDQRSDNVRAEPVIVDNSLLKDSTPISEEEIGKKEQDTVAVVPDASEKSLLAGQPEEMHRSDADILTALPIVNKDEQALVLEVEDKVVKHEKIIDKEDSQVMVKADKPPSIEEGAQQTGDMSSPIVTHHDNGESNTSFNSPEGTEKEPTIPGLSSNEGDRKKLVNHVDIAEQGLGEEAAVEKDNSNIAQNDTAAQQARIESFFAEYINTYKQRNAVSYSRFFEADALENGKLFTSMLPVYLDLFAATSQIEMDMTMLAWEAIDNGFSIRSRFKVYLLYRDAHEIHGSGAIRFVLKDNNGELRIRSMDYEFDN
ncbi:J domain-containing protein [Desulforhopalus sp. 52FAK]